mgnify:CR=1 FL=1
MSHITSLKTKLVDKDTLLKALGDIESIVEIISQESNELFLKGSNDQKYAVDIKVITKLGSEIGFRKRLGSYEIIADWWRVLGINKKTFTQQLNQRYAYHAALSKLSEQGFTLIREEIETEGKDKGKVRLLLRRIS